MKPNGYKFLIKAPCDKCGKIGKHSHGGVKGGVVYALYKWNKKKICYHCGLKSGVL